MKHLASSFLLALLLIAGCAKENSPTQAEAVNNDELLESKIVGHWKCGSSWNLTFFSNAAFIDSISFAVDSPSPVHYELYYVVKGNYSINNGLLTFPQMELVFADTTHLLPFNNMEYYIFYPSIVKFDGDNLVLNMEDVLSPANGNGKELNGSWSADNWIVQIERRPARTSFFGKVYKEFQFDESTLKYNFKLTNSFDSPYQTQNDSGSFIYSADRLSFGSYITIPEFNDGRLLLNYISWPVFYYSKAE